MLAGVLRIATENLGSGGTAGGFNLVGVMTGLAVGGAMGGQMASMTNVVDRSQFMLNAVCTSE